MTTTARALIFGTAVAAISMVTLSTVFAAEPLQVVRLDGVTVTAQRAAFETDGSLAVVRLDPVIVTGHKTIR